MHRAVAYEPPSEELSEALIVLARYVTTTEHPGSREEPFRPAQVRAWLPVPPAQPALSTWSPGASCAPASLGPAGEPAAQACAPTPDSRLNGFTVFNVINVLCRLSHRIKGTADIIYI